MIITGGENVCPSEVEKLLSSYPKVKEVAVVGTPDRKWGEIIRAVIVLVPGCEPCDDLKTDILEFCRNRIAGYKRPKLIYFIHDNDVPRTATGKIMRRLIRERDR